MKRAFLLMLILTTLSFVNPLASQHVSVGVNISSQPLWGPVGYDYVEYYYLPACDIYYSVPAAQFIYFDGGTWVYTSYLPVRYHCDLYTTYKVVINKPHPWYNHHYYVVHYAQYKTAVHKQVYIKESNDPKYFVVKGHPQYGRTAVDYKKQHPVTKKQVLQKSEHRYNSPKPVVQKKRQHQKKNGGY